MYSWRTLLYLWVINRHHITTIKFLNLEITEWEIPHHLDQDLVKNLPRRNALFNPHRTWSCISPEGMFHPMSVRTKIPCSHIESNGEKYSLFLQSIHDIWIVSRTQTNKIRGIPDIPIIIENRWNHYNTPRNDWLIW